VLDEVTDRWLVAWVLLLRHVRLLPDGVVDLTLSHLHNNVKTVYGVKHE